MDYLSYNQSNTEFNESDDRFLGIYTSSFGRYPRYRKRPWRRFYPYQRYWYPRPFPYYPYPYYPYPYPYPYYPYPWY